MHSHFVKFAKVLLVLLLLKLPGVAIEIVYRPAAGPQPARGRAFPRRWTASFSFSGTVSTAGLLRSNLVFSP